VHAAGCFPAPTIGVSEEIAFTVVPLVEVETRMAGDNSSRRFVRLWWLLGAVTLGAAIGALSGNFIGVYLTLWLALGVGGSLVAVSALFDRVGEQHRRTARPLRRAPQKMAATSFSVPPSKVSPKGKPTGARRQLRAISGKKTADPPSTGSSS